MTARIEPKVFFSTSFFFTLTVICYVLSFLAELSILNLVLHFIFLIKFYKKLPVFLLFVYSCIHSLVFYDFFVLERVISFWPAFQTENEMKVVLMSHVIFIFFLGNFISNNNNASEFFLANFKKPSILVFSLLCIILLYILLFGITGDNVIERGGYGISGAAVKSTLHEYFIMLFFLTILFGGESFLQQSIIISLLVLYSVKTMLYGGRVEVVQIWTVYFLLHYLLKSKINYFFFLFILLFGAYFNSVVGHIRANPTLLISDNLFSLFNPINIFLKNKGELDLSSTEGDVIQSSARIVGLVNTNILQMEDRFISFVGYLLAPIVPSTWLPDVSNLATYAQNRYESGGGGLVSTYFYVWFGFLGPMGLGLFLAFVLEIFYKFKSRIFFVYGACILFMFPRWFSYNPIFFMKFCLYAVLLYVFLRYLASWNIRIIKHKL